MLRKYIIIKDIKNVIFAIDKDNSDKIKKDLERIKVNTDKIGKHYFNAIAENRCTTDKYSQENYGQEIKNVTALKFKGKSTNNARIYCKDWKEGNNRIIVLCEFYIKKQTKLNQKIKNIIKRISQYEYQQKKEKTRRNSRIF